KAAELSAGKASPIPYINSVLSSWKSKNLCNPDQIEKEPLRETYFQAKQREEHDAEFKKKVRSYYFNLREKAEDRAEHYLKLARSDARFKANEDRLKACEIRLAKAEALGGETAGEQKKLNELRSERAKILTDM